MRKRFPKIALAKKTKVAQKVVLCQENCAKKVVLSAKSCAKNAVSIKNCAKSCAIFQLSKVFKKGALAIELRRESCVKTQKLQQVSQKLESCIFLGKLQKLHTQRCAAISKGISIPVYR